MITFRDKRSFTINAALVILYRQGLKTGLLPVSYTHLDILSAVEAGGIRGVAVKCLDITKNSDCEGSLLSLSLIHIYSISSEARFFGYGHRRSSR